MLLILDLSEDEILSVDVGPDGAGEPLAVVVLEIEPGVTRSTLFLGGWVVLEDEDVIVTPPEPMELVGLVVDGPSGRFDVSVVDSNEGLVMASPISNLTSFNPPLEVDVWKAL